IERSCDLCAFGRRREPLENSPWAAVLDGARKQAQRYRAAGRVGIDIEGDVRSAGLRRVDRRHDLINTPGCRRRSSVMGEVEPDLGLARYLQGVSDTVGAVGTIEIGAARFAHVYFAGVSNHPAELDQFRGIGPWAGIVARPCGEADRALIEPLADE